eukprot:CAMPEP_0172606850 /NCGR_PEP_ID=MMETSP1068-20121228/27060_1 /TAXON_ID=35684 /ORGANISM="Pseudopedinella elastica, Strain CCMP716" /LENGTH=68 /DNA_ID=CAMNT_0013409703 /DNA_START=98 /DNA_END=301 /DNA_ORIENTATION=+
MRRRFPREGDRVRRALGSQKEKMRGRQFFKGLSNTSHTASRLAVLSLGAPWAWCVYQVGRVRVRELAR